ncbi:K(lysine) acetyltransferase [Coemansia sp. RSA 1933]|nr:K(lysine) acetyltransferase [Coemansia sp. RSA 1933]
MGKPPKKKQICGHGRNGALDAKRKAGRTRKDPPCSTTKPDTSIRLVAETQSSPAAAEEEEIRSIIIGNYSIAAWYASPYPEEYKRSHELYICERCLKYMRFRCSLESHRCPDPFPRGRRVYEDAGAALYEVDGKEHALYCQNLCLLSKLFLDQKTIFYDIGGFLFYILLVRQQQTSSNSIREQRSAEPYGDYTFAGYFSKEKASVEKNNLACIIVLPPFRGQNYGQLLIELSYELTKRESTTGGPEQPLSSQGFHSYRSHWRRAIVLALLGQSEPADNHNLQSHNHNHKSEKDRRFFSLSRLAHLTGIRIDDILFTLEDLDLLGSWLGRHIVCVSDEALYKTIADNRISLGIRMDPNGLDSSSSNDASTELTSGSDECDTDTTPVGSSDESNGNNSTDGDESE